MTAARRLTALTAPFFPVGLPLRIRAWDGSEAGPRSAPQIEVTSRTALRRLMWQPNELGLAQAFIAGEIDAPGGATALASGLRAVWDESRAARPVGRVGSAARLAGAAVRAVALGAVGPRPPAVLWPARADGVLHSVDRDRTVIAHHYDVPTDFYALFLDPAMAYSCAYYARPDASLAQAQRSKLEGVCERLELRPGMRLLDIGCGWGSLILHAAEEHGVRAVGITLSSVQHEFVARAIRDRGLSDLVCVRQEDYRALDVEPADAVASLEMGEHVGENNYPEFVDTLFRHLEPGGRLMLQQMSRPADAAPGGGPFIETYIAPDMWMRPLTETRRYLDRGGFDVLATQDLRGHYVRTVADWLAAYESRLGDAAAIMGEPFARAWLLYLVGGGLAFEQGRMGVDQILATRPESGVRRATRG